MEPAELHADVVELDEQEQSGASDPDPEHSAFPAHTVADKLEKERLRALELQRRQKQQWEWQMRQQQARQVWMVPPAPELSQLPQFQQQAVPQQYATYHPHNVPPQHVPPHMVPPQTLPPQMARGLPEGLAPPPQMPQRLGEAPPHYLPPGAVPMGIQQPGMRESTMGIHQPGMQQRMPPPGMQRMPPGMPPGMQPRMYPPGAQPQHPGMQPRMPPPGMHPSGVLPPGMHPSVAASLHSRGMLPPGGPSQMRPHQPHHQRPMHAPPAPAVLANTIMELRQGTATHPADQAPPPSLPSPVHPSLRTDTHHPSPFPHRTRRASSLPPLA